MNFQNFPIQTKTDSNSQTLYEDRIDSLAQELEDTREKLRIYRRIGLSGACAYWDNSKIICAT